MKKKIAKQLRQIALYLPPSVEEYNIIQIHKGSDMLDMINKAEEATLEEGYEGPLFNRDDHFKGIDVIDPNGTYRQATTQLRDLNHYNRLKKYYAKYGMHSFVKEYTAFLRRHNKAMAKKYPEWFEQRNQYLARERKKEELVLEGSKETLPIYVNKTQENEQLAQ